MFPWRAAVGGAEPGARVGRHPVRERNAAHYRATTTITEVVEFGSKPHLLPAAPGWEEIADFVLAWAVRHAVAPPPIVGRPPEPAEPVTV